jgi:hypothetical protein
MAARGRLWGAERIRGELLKLGIKVSKRTIQKYMRSVRGRSGGGQSWATFVKNHAERMWVCDFIQTYDLLFRQVYAFFLVHLASRRVSISRRLAIWRRRGPRSSCATPPWTGTIPPSCCGIATTSSVRAPQAPFVDERTNRDEHRPHQELEAPRRPPLATAPGEIWCACALGERAPWRRLPGSGIGERHGSVGAARPPDHARPVRAARNAA